MWLWMIFCLLLLKLWGREYTQNLNKDTDETAELLKVLRFFSLRDINEAVSQEKWGLMGPEGSTHNEELGEFYVSILKERLCSNKLSFSQCSYTHPPHYYKLSILYSQQCHWLRMLSASATIDCFVLFCSLFLSPSISPLCAFRQIQSHLPTNPFLNVSMIAGFWLAPSRVQHHPGAERNPEGGQQSTLIKSCPKQQVGGRSRSR